MKIRDKLAGTLALALICMTGPATAKEIAIAGHGASQVKKGCGGTYLPPSKSNGSYGCVNDDGHGIYCGGETKKQNKTCTTFLIVGSGGRAFVGRADARTR